jgi:ABC-type phosphate/phosphonate transport system substrate-binding protein
MERAARRIASLPWYDLREIRWATDRFWGCVSEHLRAQGVDDVPAAPERGLSCFEQWTRPELLFSQACGYDVRLAYAEHLQLVATPCYAAPGCEGPTYSSFVVVHADAGYREPLDLRGARCVINTPTSHSGMNILRSLVAPLHQDGRFFSSVLVSGAHSASLGHIVDGTADVAAVDCVTYELLRRHRPAALASTRVLARTERVAAPPFVTRRATPPETVAALRRALAAALADPGCEEARRAMLLEGAEPLTLESYRRIAELEELAGQYGYAEIEREVRRETRSDAG